MRATPSRSALSRFTLDELAQRKGVRPVRSLVAMARPDVFESDAELEEFLAYTAAKQHTDLA
jgi:hypothetical protein